MDIIHESLQNNHDMQNASYPSSMLHSGRGLDGFHIVAGLPPQLWRAAWNRWLPALSRCSCSGTTQRSSSTWLRGTRWYPNRKPTRRSCRHIWHLGLLLICHALWKQNTMGLVGKLFSNDKHLLQNYCKRKEKTSAARPGAGGHVTSLWSYQGKLPVDNWNASIIMVVILVPTLAILPIIIQSHITKAQVAQGGGNSIHFTLLGHHSIHDALHQRLIPSWTLSHPLTNRSFGGSHSLRRWTKYLKAPATYIGYMILIHIELFEYHSMLSFILKHM